MIGLAGTHRTGKTTLALAYADHYDEYIYLPTNVSAVLKGIGFEADKPMSLQDRLYVQRVVLEHLKNVYAEAQGTKFITDRTPLCALGYLFAEVTVSQETQSLSSELDSYYQDCIELTRKVFSTVAIVPMAIPIVYEEGKGNLCPAVMRMQELTIMGAALKCKGLDAFIIQEVDLDLRIHELRAGF